MARNKIGIKGSDWRRIRKGDQVLDESDEEYKATDDEDSEESDECYSLDGDESEDISVDLGKSKRVIRSRNTRRTSSSKKVVEIMKPCKRKRVSYPEDDNDDEEDDDDDDEFKLMEKKKVSYTEVDDDDSGGECKEFVIHGRNKKQRKNPREKKRVVYTYDDGDEFVFSGGNRNQKKKHREKKGVVYTDDDDDFDEDDDDEFVSLGRKRNQRKKPQEKRVVCTDDDDEFVFSGRKRNQRKKPQEKKVVCTDDDDDDEFVFSGRKRSERNKPQEKKGVEYTDDDDDFEVDFDDDDDDEFVSSGRKRNQKKKPQKKRIVCTDDDDIDDDNVVDDDDEFVSSCRKRNQRKKPREKRVVHTDDDFYDDDDDDDDDDDEFVSSGTMRDKRKKPQEKRVVYTEEDEVDDDKEFVYSCKKVNKKRNLRENKVPYTEDHDDGVNDDDLVFMSKSTKKNKINKRREKRIVSYKEDDENEEDESDAEFKLSESDFVDDDEDEDETPNIKKNKVIKPHLQKKSVRVQQKKIKKSKKATKIKKQPNHKFVTNKTRNKISKRQKQKTMAESDSDFVNSASSDHEYTISEEEREQMREAKIYCKNFRAKLRWSSCENQEKHEQKTYPIRKGKEKIEQMKDELVKQVCGICLSEEQKRTIRGVLNCCHHYFCFSCIIEWSKVESRCPLCKQRFTTVTKAAKSDNGFDLRTVVIPVPECDQVYEPTEEELRGYIDPYESVICTECQNGGDDDLMLLCDICDSSAHTFCVGLGREVPEGNWYCEGCKPTVFGTLNSQHLTPPNANSDRRLNNNTADISSSSSTPIVGGFDLNELYVPETPLTQQTTLRDRRRIHRQIHHRFLNNNRMNDLVGRSSGTSTSSSSGIILFGSQIDRARVSVTQNDHVFPAMHDLRDQFSVQIQNSNLASADVALQDEHASLQEFSIREVIGPSRT